jgi:hypothetical protein
MPWPSEWNRENVRREIEEATGAGLSVDDPLPDTLCAVGQALGMKPAELRIWINDGHPKRPDEWNAANLTRWAERYGIGRFRIYGPTETTTE